MTLHIGIQADPLSLLDPITDSTMLLAREAQARGYNLYFYTPEQLYLEEGHVKALVQKTTLAPHNVSPPYETSAPYIMSLKELDVVLLRKDPPFDINYILSTYLIEKLEEHCLVLNSPASIRNFHGKISCSEFTKYLVPYAITQSLDVLKAFHAEHKDIILKPLNAKGGAGVTRILPETSDLKIIYDSFYQQFPETFILQKFIPEADIGDKRITFIDGEPAAAILRVPAEAGALANISAGATAVATELSPIQTQFCTEIASHFIKNNLFLVGVDFLGDYLTEINVISPGTLVATNEIYGMEIEKIFWNKIEARLNR